MTRVKDIALLVAVTLLAVQAVLFSGAGASAAQQMKPLLAKIVNTTDEPVPVSLQGTGAVNGEVTVNNSVSNPLPVSGEVAVSNNPTVQAQQSGEWSVRLSDETVSTSSTLASKHHTIQHFSDFVEDPKLHELPETINASLIMVSSSEDDATIIFQRDALRVFEVGNAVTELPSVVTIPLSQRIPINGVYVSCHNVVEQCEITISIVGD